MKKSIKSYLDHLTKNEIHQLTTLVEETIAVGLIEKQQKSFTAADLWNIQRNARTRTIRKFF